jgi:hypothetical protein
MPERRHDCPGECGRTVGYRMFACPDCWRRLPGELQADVLRTFRRRSTDPAAHRRAMLAANNWYRAHPLRGVA